MLLDRAFLAGLGNYLRAEILWQAELAPQHKPQDLTPEALRRGGGIAGGAAPFLPDARAGG